MKSSKETEKKIRLVVEAGDPVVEIFVIDGQFNLVNKGIGSLDIELTPGLYKVKFKAGSVIKEREAILEPGKALVRVEAPELEFSSPAPLPHTRTLRREHMENAQDLSREVHEQVGQGGQLFLFVRDLETGLKSNPAQGLSLCSLDGERLFYLKEVGRRNIKQQWAGSTVALDPGIYRLRMQTNVSGALEQTVVISPGWQTQVFLLRRSFGKRERSARRADLTNASVFMTRLGEGFSPERPDLRWTELARMELNSTRCLVPQDQIEDLFEIKRNNPLLALFCAHMLLNGKEVKADFVHKMVDRLHDMLGEHPDVNALLLRLAEVEQNRDIQVPPYLAPPMLRNSWKIVVQSSAERPELVPARSLANRIASHLWGSGTWLVWQPPDEIGHPKEQADLPDLDKTISEIEPFLTEPELLDKFSEESELDELERSLLRYLTLTRPTAAHTKGVIYRLDDEEDAEDEGEDPYSNDNIIKAMGVPNSSIRRAAANLAEKLQRGLSR